MVEAPMGKTQIILAVHGRAALHSPGKGGADMMHFRQRVLACDEKQAKKRERKYTQWRKENGRRRKYFKKLVKTQPKRS